MRYVTKSVMVPYLAAGWISLMLAGALLAAGSAYPASPGAVGLDETARNLSEGTFDGYNRKTGRLWVSDRVYQYTHSLKVIGTPKKAGLLSNIQLGEPLLIQFEKRSGQIPKAIEIRRK